MNEYTHPDIAAELAAIGAQSHYVEVDGIRTHYIEVGTGPLLVLVHGGGAGADSWGNWKSCLPAYAKNFRVIAPDMPGFGRTGKPDPSQYDYSQESRNRHLIALLEKLGAGPVNIIGNSMGGATALGIAIERPDLINKMVLMGSAGLAIANPDPSYMQAFSSYDYTREAMRVLMKALAGPRYVIDEELLNYRHELMQDPAAQKAIDVIRRSKITYFKDVISSIKLPTLVVGGKEDQVAILARTYGYLELIENSWGFVLPHVGHWAMMEAPKEFVSITTAFFSKDLF
ncbi:alpha/beta fold hydrolase [Herbaspirillum lusitanum]|uniref:alpha/beta fold hydrolase n=1 Tax=Herbaspirillum lusitanum TaxID=213312 RepID=UPI0003799178|nr:alpha/beta hydrolase [Herbaspirillum lusitanum]